MVRWVIGSIRNNCKWRYVKSVTADGLLERFRVSPFRGDGNERSPVSGVFERRPESRVLHRVVERHRRIERAMEIEHEAFDGFFFRESRFYEVRGVPLFEPMPPFRALADVGVRKRRSVERKALPHLANPFGVGRKLRIVVFRVFFEYPLHAEPEAFRGFFRKRMRRVRRSREKSFRGFKIGADVQFHGGHFVRIPHPSAFALENYGHRERCQDAEKSERRIRPEVLVAFADSRIFLERPDVSVSGIVQRVRADFPGFPGGSFLVGDVVDFRAYVNGVLEYLSLVAGFENAPFLLKNPSGRYETFQVFRHVRFDLAAHAVGDFEAVALRIV